MEERVMYVGNLTAFEAYLRDDEKSIHTVEKYLRDVRTFCEFAGRETVTKETVLRFREHLVSTGYTSESVNSMLASVNSLLKFLGWEDCRVRYLRTQRKMYCPEEKELTKAEYLRLLEAARQKPRLFLVLETICATGIRISELRYFTVEAVNSGEITVKCKNKTRSILVPGKLRKKLMAYTKKNHIGSGVIFRTRSGRPVDRSNIWAEMKKLCAAAHVQESKVFPHNLRKLFARTFHKTEKDIAKLADVLGHSNINTTRIYIMTTSLEHRRCIERLGLVV